jgi:hypothetical protein
MCGIIFKNVDHIYCKIKAVQVKKRVFFASCNVGLANFDSPWRKTFVLHKVDVFYIILENWAKIKYKESPKPLYFHFGKNS